MGNNILNLVQMQMLRGGGETKSKNDYGKTETWYDCQSLNADTSNNFGLGSTRKTSTE